MVQNTQEKLGNSLLKNLIGLREQKGEIRIEDVGALLQGMATSLQGTSEPDKFIRAEMEKMAQYIVNAKAEISALVPDDAEEETSRNINRATMELDEVVKATEKATNTIMDVADAIQEAASNISDAEASAKIMEETMKLYDACSFQDITGQRINKVLKTFAEVEAHIMSLLQLFGGTLPEGYVPAEKHDRPDEALMEGPQLSSDAPDQADIDKLFDSI